MLSECVLFDTGTAMSRISSALDPREIARHSPGPCANIDILSEDVHQSFLPPDVDGLKIVLLQRLLLLR